MKTRFVAYNRLGARRGVLTHILQAELVPSKNELPTLTLTYPRAQPTHQWLTDSPEVAFEYYHNNQWVEPKNARFKLVTTDFDYLEEVETRNYSFIGIGEAIRGVYVFGANGLPRNDEGKVQFANATPGQMLSHVWDYAVKRGWKGFSKSFHATAATGGAAWKNRLSISFADDTSLESMLMYLSRMGLIDFEWEGRTLNVYNADTVMARDLSTGNNPLKFNLSGGRASVDSAPESNDHENLATHVVVTGEEGLRWVFPTGLVLPEGRREVFLNYSGVDDEGTAQILAAPTIAKYSNSLKNTTRQFQIGPSTISFPFIDYGIGDWALIEKDEGQWERVQIFQMSLMINNNGVQGYVSLGDKIDSLLERLNEAVQRVQGGSVNEGTEPVAPSTRRPSKPYGVVTTSRTMYTTRGEARGIIGVNWAHDGKDVSGDSIVINDYIVEYRRKTTANNGSWMRLFSGPEMSGTHSWVDVRDENNQLITYQIRVTAVSSHEVKSQPSDIELLVMHGDSTPPSRPAKPTIKVSLAVFEVGTTHRTTTGSLQDVDYSHTIVEMGTTATGPWVERSTIVPPAQTAYIGGEGYTTRWFRLVAVDWEGNRSEPSDVVSETAKSIVDEELVLTEIDAAKVRITNAGKIVLENGTLLTAKLADNDTAIASATSAITNLRDVALPALNTSLTAATGRLTTAEGKITAAQTAITAANTEITKVANRVGPIETGLNLLNTTTIPNLTTSINGKSMINRQTTVAANPGNYSLGDRWEQWDKLTAGGKLLKTWRHNGTAWIEEVIAASYLPQIDIGAGTFGSLEGGRLTANSVSAQSLMVGSFSNLIENGNFEYGNKSWGTATNWSVDPTGGRYGTGAMKVSGITVRTLGPLSAINIPIEFGDSYRLSAWVKTTSYFSHAELCLYYYRADGSFFGNQNLTFHPISPVNEWNRYSGIITPNVPAENGPVYLRFRINSTMGWDQDSMYFDDVTLTKATDGKLVVNGSITGDHVDAESVAAKVGTFVKINVQNLTATHSSNLNDLVAQKIAAGTASFQTVDAKNIFVTGTASLEEVVARRFAAETGTFLTLGVDQLTVTGTANMKEVVADRMFANLFDTRKLTANQVLIGHPGNVLPDPMHLDPVMLQRRNAASTMTVSMLGNDLLLTPGTANTYFRPYGVPQNTVDYSQWLSVKPGEVWRWTIGLRSMRAEGWMQFVGRTINGQAYANPTERTIIPASLSGNTYSVEAKIPANCYWIIPEMMLPAGTQTTTVEQGSMSLHQVMTPELIVDGAITTKKLVVTEEMTAALLKAKKVEAGEINFNSLFGDTGFIGDLKTTVLTSNAITTDLLSANAITSKHTITGALLRSAASGARTEMTNQGIRVVNSSNIDQVRLGYGIATGMSVLNPYSGVMTPLQQHVFGTTVLKGTLKSSSTDEAGVAFNNSSTTGWALRVIRDQTTFQPMTFTAQSTRAVILMQLDLRAWVSTGIKTTGPESIPASTAIWIRGNGSTPDPLYQMNIMPPMAVVPYRMVNAFTASIMHHVENLVVGNSYQVELRLRNEDRDTPNSRLYWGNIAAIILPI